MNYIVKVYTYDAVKNAENKIIIDNLILDSSAFEVIIYRNKSVLSSPNSAMSVSRIISANNDILTQLYEGLQLSADGDTIYVDVSYQASADTEIINLIQKQSVHTCRMSYGLKAQHDAGIYEEVMKEEITINFTN